MAREKRELMGVMFNDTLKTITDYQHEYHRKHSAKYIYVFDKEKQTAFCSRCETNFMFDHKTKHKSVDTCPHCGKKMEIIHDWRIKKYPEIYEYMCIPKVLDSHTLVLRFLEASSGWDNLRIKTQEVARMYIDEYRTQPEFWCYKKRKWTKHKQPYFNQCNAFYMENKHFVGYAYEYPRNFFKELNKLDCFKYWNIEDKYMSNRYPMQLHYLVKSARINEKLFKIGFEHIQSEHLDYYNYHGDKCLQVNLNKTDLIGMLNLDKPRWDIFKNYCHYGANASKYNANVNDLAFLKFLQSNKNITHEKLVIANFDVRTYRDYEYYSKQLGVTFKKFGRYMYNYQGVNGQPSKWEYKHYIRILDELGYNLKDTYYSMPKDFRKADERITAEWNARQEELRKLEEKEQLEKDKRNNEMIAKISKGLMELPEIKELCGNSKGLLVYVPDSAAALHKEGKEMHHCVGTYVESVATKKTLIFFVRRLKDPTAPFVTMEITYDGIVRQMMYAHDIVVQDKNIIDFASKVADIVKKHSKELLKVA